MIVVSDTTCITTLLKAGELQILRALVDSVMVPEAVARELRAFHADLPEMISVRAVHEPQQRLPGTEHLGQGEAEAIQLAREIGAELFLSDDRQARAAAIRLGLTRTGLLGLLVRAKRLEFISSVGEKIQALQERGGLYLSEAVKAEALKAAGE